MLKAATTTTAANEEATTTTTIGERKQRKSCIFQKKKASSRGGGGGGSTSSSLCSTSPYHISLMIFLFMVPITFLPMYKETQQFQANLLSFTDIPSPSFSFLSSNNNSLSSLSSKLKLSQSISSNTNSLLSTNSSLLLTTTTTTTTTTTIDLPSSKSICNHDNSTLSSSSHYHHHQVQFDTNSMESNHHHRRHDISNIFLPLYWEKDHILFGTKETEVEYYHHYNPSSSSSSWFFLVPSPNTTNHDTSRTDENDRMTSGRTTTTITTTSTTTDTTIGNNTTNNKIQLELTTATCQYMFVGQSNHMAHGSQQLYRCISWWITHPTLPRYLLKKHIKQPLNRYLASLQQVLVDAFNVTIITNYNYLQHHHSTIIKQPRVTSLMSHTTSKNTYPHFAMIHGRNDSHYFRDTILEYYQLQNNQRFKNAGCHYYNVDQDQDDHDQDHNLKTKKNKKMIKRLPIIGIIDRKEGRQILNVQELATRLVTEFGPDIIGGYNNYDGDDGGDDGDIHQQQSQVEQVGIEIMYFENKTYQEQIQYMSQIDILLSSHGAQLVSIPFMPNCGGIIEFFQPGYYIPYYFGSLAYMSGLQHGSYYTGQNTIEHDLRGGGKKRVKTRQANICIQDMDTVIEGVRTMIHQWNTCCLSSKQTNINNNINI